MITFIIPAHNEERLLGRTLDALRVAAEGVHQPHEVIVVDDASTDATSAVAARHGARAVRIDRRQIAAARNAGARQASGDLFVFVDADTVISRAVLERALHAVRGGAVGGGAPARFEGRVPLYGRLALWVWLRVQRIGGLASGCFLFCTRQAFDAAGGFDETIFVGEDVDLSWRLRRFGRFRIVPEPVVTSGRMVRSYSALEAIGLFASVVCPGLVGIRRRAGHWYRPRRDDPDAAPGAADGR